MQSTRRTIVLSIAAATLLGHCYLALSAGSSRLASLLVAATTLIGGLLLAQIAIDQLRQAVEARRAAEEARARAEHGVREAADREAAALVRYSTERRELLSLLHTLELPIIALADDVLLAPIGGQIDSQRAVRLKERLCSQLEAHKARYLILDMAGLSPVNQETGLALLDLIKELQRLEIDVSLTGISPRTALSLTRLQIPLNNLSTARAPQDILRKLTVSPEIVLN